MAQIDEVRRAVQALYHSSAEQQRNEANQWLMAFAKTAEAWQAAHALLLEPEEEVQYFGANLLFMKVRSEWHSMPDANKGQVYEGIWGLVRALADSEGGGAAEGWRRLTAGNKRLCLALAAAAARATGAAENCVQQALALSAEPKFTSIALELLTGIPQEVLEEERLLSDSAEARGQLRALLPQVLGLLGSTASRSEEACASCMRCLQAWLSLNAGGSLAVLYQSYQPLLHAALSALASPNEALNSAAAEAMLEVLSATNTQLAPTAPQACEAVEQVGGQLSHLATQLELLSAAKDGGEVDERQFHFCRVLAVFCERAVDVIAVTSGSLLPLAQLMLSLLGGELRLAELSVDFWVGLQDTAPAHRNPQLGLPLYRSLLELVLRKSTLPQGFTEWEESEVEEETFLRFREQGAKAVLDCCLQLLHAEMVSSMRQLVVAGQSEWRQLEVSLFVIRGLHLELKSVLAREAGGAAAELPPAQLREQQVAVAELVDGLLQMCSEWQPQGQPQMLVIGAVRFLGAFAKRLNTEHPDLLLGSLRLVLESLSCGVAAEHAAAAFRNVCQHGSGTLASKPESIMQVLAACKPHLSGETLPFEPRLALVEGLARCVGQMRPVEVARGALQQLIAIPCERLHALLQQLPMPPPPPAQAPQPSTAQAEAIALQMNLIGSSIKFCDKFSDKLGHDNHPVSAVLGQVLALLHEAARRCGMPPVVQALYDFYSKAMLTMRKLLVSYMPQLLLQLRDSFLCVPMSGCLEVVTQALELYGAEEHDDEVKQTLTEVLERMVEAVCGWLSQPGLGENEPALITAFFEMCHRALVFRPGLLLDMPCVPQLFDSAIGCVCHQEFNHTRNAISFLVVFMSGTDAHAQYRETAAHCLQASGVHLLRSCLTGLATASPANLIDHQVELMRVLVEACPSAVQSWLLRILQEPSFGCGALPPRGPAMEYFVQLIVQHSRHQPALSTGDFQSVVSDFSRMCRGKMDPSPACWSRLTTQLPAS